MDSVRYRIESRDSRILTAREEIVSCPSGGRKQVLLPGGRSLMPGGQAGRKTEKAEPVGQAPREDDWLELRCFVLLHGLCRWLRLGLPRSERTEKARSAHGCIVRWAVHPRSRSGTEETTCKRIQRPRQRRVWQVVTMQNDEFLSWKASRLERLLRRC